MVSTASRGGMIGLLVRQLLMGSVLGHRYGLAARDRLPHRCWTVPCPFACCRKVRRATALFVHIGSGLRGGECGDSGLHSRLRVADLEEDLVVGAGSVRGGIWSRAFLPLEPIFAGIRTRRTLRVPISTPDIRVVAENAMNLAPAGATWRFTLYFSCISVMMERPSAVSSASLARNAASEIGRASCRERV